MALASLRDQDRLDGASNFSFWKARISLLLEENSIKVVLRVEELCPRKEIEGL